MMKTIYLALLLMATVSFVNAETNSPPVCIDPQIYSNASSSQSYATFELVRQLLENNWNEKLYQQFMYYEGTNWEGIERTQKQFVNDKVWGPWFKKKLAFQKKIYKELNPLVEKKRKGEDMSKEDLTLLSEIHTRIYEQLVK